VNRTCCLQACQSRIERSEGEAREKAEILAHLFAQVVAVHRVLLQQPQDRQLEHAANISQRHIKSICRLDAFRSLGPWQLLSLEARLPPEALSAKAGSHRFTRSLCSLVRRSRSP